MLREGGLGVTGCCLPKAARASLPAVGFAVGANEAALGHPPVCFSPAR